MDKNALALIVEIVAFDVVLVAIEFKFQSSFKAYFYITSLPSTNQDRKMQGKCRPFFRFLYNL